MAVSIARINRTSVAGSVTERLVSLITQGQLKPGDKLPSEKELMRALDVGRSSVREALRSLSVLGIIESRPRLGSTVVSQTANALGDNLRNSLTKSGLADVFEVRVLLERHAAGRAAQQASPAEVEAIAAAALAVERRAESGKSYFAENARFHVKIAEASHNPVLAHCLRSIISSLRDVREHANAIIRGMPEQDVEDHRQILEAIRSGDAPRARRSMEVHLSRTARKLVDR